MKFYKISLVTLTVFAALFFNACKKVEVIKSLDGRGQTIVKMLPDDASNPMYNLRAIDVTNTPQVVSLIELRRDVPNEAELNKSLTVTLVLDTAAISNYNLANGTALSALPTSTFNYNSTNPLVNGRMTVTFQPGEIAKLINITVPDATIFDFDTRYALAFSILEPVSGGTGRVSFENRTAVVEISIKNAYDGVYKLNGSFVHPTAAYNGFFTRSDIELRTTGPNTNVMFFGLAGGLGHPFTNAGQINYFANQAPIYNIDPTTNQVTVTNSFVGGTNVVYTMIPGYDSHYDPTTRTIYASYGYNSNSRIYTDTLKYIGPR